MSFWRNNKREKGIIDQSFAYLKEIPKCLEFECFTGLFKVYFLKIFICFLFWSIFMLLAWTGKEIYTFYIYRLIFMLPLDKLLY